MGDWAEANYGMATSARPSLMPPPEPKPAAEKSSQPSGGDFVNVQVCLKNMAFDVMSKMLSDVNAAAAAPPPAAPEAPPHLCQKEHLPFQHQSKLCHLYLLV